MSQFSILAADKAQDVMRWIQIWKKWPGREVFAHPNYLRLFATDSSKAVCALLEGPSGIVLYPFFLRDVNSDVLEGDDRNVRDIVSPYGYGGAFVVRGDDEQSLAKDFWEAFDSWCEGSNVVSEFVRFSLFSDTLIDFPGEVEAKQENVVRSLQLSPEKLWMDFDHKVRKNVNKAQRSGVTIEIDTTGQFFDDFFRIYTHTMHRRSASSGYYFDERFFRSIHDSLPGQFAYFHARHDGLIVSSELVLVSGATLYSFLGGTVGDAFHLRPNDLLKYEIMLWGAKNGKSAFVLGGGYTADDGIYKYKKAFAPNGTLPFTVGRRILNADVYARLVENRIRAHAREGDQVLRTGFFPAYRA